MFVVVTIYQPDDGPMVVNIYGPYDDWREARNSKDRFRRRTLREEPVEGKKVAFKVRHVVERTS